MNNVPNDKAYSFAIRIVEAYKWLCKEHKECVLSKHLLRCGTSIGANVSKKAIGTVSKPEFKAKMSTARKEVREMYYWLRLLKESEIVSESQLSEIMQEADEIIHILTAIVKTSQTRSASGTKAEG